MMRRFAWMPVLLLAAMGLFGCGGGGSEEGAEKAAETVAETVENAPQKSEAPKTMTADEMKTALAEKLQIDLSDMVEHESGLKWIVREEGTGAVPQKGQRIKAHYTGYLLNGTKFDSSVDRGAPFETPIGVGRVIQGWDIAFTNMKVGEKRVLFIPPSLAYGAQGAGNVIPPNAELVFDVSLIDIMH
ncbi:MAG: FKBP-type peptidyl-prolyl cis-trans isomerase [Candidatus Eisenbacteria bacterium]